MAKKTILHMDDVEKWRTYVRVLLSDDYKVLPVKSADKVPGVLQKKSVDLAILDLLIPGKEPFGTGADVAHYVKEHFPKIPVILFSGAWEGLEHANRSKIQSQTGADAVVFKIKQDPDKDDLKKQVEILMGEE